MRLGVVGINEKVAELQLRETLAKVCQERFCSDVGPADATPLVVLSTCNRTEVYFSSPDLAETQISLLRQLRCRIDGEFDQKLYSFFGKDCFHHLVRVTAGLDSAILAETEIQGQVRKAYEEAANKRSLSRELHYAFQKALKIGKQVRATLPLTRGMPDLEHAIHWAGRQVLGDVCQAQLLFVGASEINRKVLSFMKRKGCRHITLCNRSLHVGCELAAKQGVQLLPWEQLALWQEFDWVIFGTKAPDYLVSARGNLAPAKTRLMIDLGVPRNVDPGIALQTRLHILNQAKLRLLNIDQLHDMLHVRRQSLAPLVHEAESLVINAISRSFASFQRPCALHVG